MSDYTIDVLECDTHDTRLRRRHLQNGRLSPAALKSHLDSLPDVAAEGEDVVVYLGADPVNEDEAAEN